MKTTKCEHKNWTHSGTLKKKDGGFILWKSVSALDIYCKDCNNFIDARNGEVLSLEDFFARGESQEVRSYFTSMITKPLKPYVKPTNQYALNYE